MFSYSEALKVVDLHCAYMALATLTRLKNCHVDLDAIGCKWRPLISGIVERNRKMFDPKYTSIKPNALFADGTYAVLEYDIQTGLPFFYARRIPEWDVTFPDFDIRPDRGVPTERNGRVLSLGSPWSNHTHKRRVVALDDLSSTRIISSKPPITVARSICFPISSPAIDRTLQIKRLVLPDLDDLEETVRSVREVLRLRQNVVAAHTVVRRTIMDLPIYGELRNDLPKFPIDQSREDAVKYSERLGLGGLDQAVLVIMNTRIDEIV